MRHQGPAEGQHAHRQHPEEQHSHTGLCDFKPLSTETLKYLAIIHIISLINVPVKFPPLAEWG